VPTRCGLDLEDVKWGLGPFGKVHVRYGKGSRGSGPRERMVPLINGSGRTLQWFIEDVWGQFGDDHTRPGAPLFPAERVKASAGARRLGPDTLRAALAEATRRHLPGWEGKLTPARAAALLRVPALPERDGPDRSPGGPRARLGGHHDAVRACSP
jgi:hypothetical protein